MAIQLENTLAYLHALVDYEKTPAQAAAAQYLHLDRMRDALARTGDPHARLRTVHIAGTKGKGSTAAMLAGMLRAAGLRVGLFTSPHLVDFHERIRVDDTLIPEEALVEIIDELRPTIEAMRDSAHGAPTFFETFTLLAFHWFARAAVDIAVLETGMGGRLDATNVVTPLASAITTIALDHTVELGDTLALIAAEKAGIIKPGVPVVSAAQAPEAAEVIARIAAEHGSPLYRVGEELRVVPSTFYSPVGQRFTVIGRLGAYADLTCPLLGEHQLDNAAVAIGLGECLRDAGVPLTPRAIRAGLAGVNWPGRLQVLQERPLLVLDGAHDPAAIDALLAALARHYPERRRRFVVGFSREKDWPQMLRQLAPAAVELVVTAASTSRAVPPAVLAAEAAALGLPVMAVETPGDAVAAALARTAPDDLLCITGSLYVVGDTLRWWHGR